MSNAGPGEKKMHVGEMHAGEVWTDILGWQKGEVIVGQDGYGDFTSSETSVSVWVNREAEGRGRFGKLYVSFLFDFSLG
jgi:alpha-amylase